MLPPATIGAAIWCGLTLRMGNGYDPVNSAIDEPILTNGSWPTRLAMRSPATEGRDEHEGEQGDRPQSPGRAGSAPCRCLPAQHGAVLGGRPQRRPMTRTARSWTDEGGALRLEIQARHRAAALSLRRADHDRVLRAPLAGARQSRPGAAARHRQHDVHRLPPERSERDHAAASPFAQCHPLRPHRQHEFHRRRGREHHLRPRRHGADAARHLAQSRQPGRRSRDQSQRARPAARARP